MVLESHWGHECAESSHSSVPARRPQEVRVYSCGGKAEVVREILGCWWWQCYRLSTEESRHRVRMSPKKAIWATGSRAGEAGLPKPSGVQWFHHKSQMPNMELPGLVLVLLHCAFALAWYFFCCIITLPFGIRTPTLHHCVVEQSVFCNIIQANRDWLNLTRDSALTLSNSTVLKTMRSFEVMYLCA